MDPRFWNEAVCMLQCMLTIALVATPFALVGWWLGLRWKVAVVPRIRLQRAPWTGFEVIAIFIVVGVMVPAVVSTGITASGLLQQVYGEGFPAHAAIEPSEEASAALAGGPAARVSQDRLAELSAVRGLWFGIISLPVQLVILAVVWNVAYHHWSPQFVWRQIPPRVAFAVLAWAAITPIVLVVHTGVNLLFTQLDWHSGDHPLSKLSAARPLLDHVLFFVQAGVAAPLLEEVLFRGLLLMWLLGGRSAFHSHPLTNAPGLPADRRVWPVFGLGIVFAALTTWDPRAWAYDLFSGAITFAVALVLGWVLIRRMTRKRRTLGAIYASAALFAVIHSSVWPTPIPLFVLGLALGWLAVRSGGVVVPFIVHGMFNVVSVLFVLRCEV